MVRFAKTTSFHLFMFVELQPFLLDQIATLLAILGVEDPSDPYIPIQLENNYQMLVRFQDTLNYSYFQEFTITIEPSKFFKDRLQVCIGKGGECFYIDKKKHTYLYGLYPQTSLQDTSDTENLIVSR